MLIYSMNVSVDGFVADREGAFGWTVPNEELFRFHTAQIRELGGYLLGRRLYETMLPWETDPSMRDNELGDPRAPVPAEAAAAFAEVWGAIPKVVFSRTLDSVQGNARLTEASVAEEAAVALDATDKDVLDRWRRPGRGGDRARARRRAAHVPPPPRPKATGAGAARRSHTAALPPAARSPPRRPRGPGGARPAPRRLASASRTPC